MPEQKSYEETFQRWERNEENRTTTASMSNPQKPRYSLLSAHYGRASTRTSRLLNQLRKCPHEKQMSDPETASTSSQDSSTASLKSSCCCSNSSSTSSSFVSPKSRHVASRPPKQRLLVVANRLPVSATRGKDNSWKLEISAGGLVSALLGLKQFEAKWIGWAGVNVPDEEGQIALTNALAQKDLILGLLSGQTFQ
eukprot:TRINITY_DN36399_c0_g1_i1.p1 TRINITY_DN36399_c0_g1~~TRINITY_DN36399_c0_g1_i1.p1  ORF type:complete len:196 (-),score=36.22 TRINITY_DN36399_c0_g1_i1:34-621(-)